MPVFIVCIELPRLHQECFGLVLDLPVEVLGRVFATLNGVLLGLIRRSNLRGCYLGHHVGVFDPIGELLVWRFPVGVNMAVY